MTPEDIAIWLKEHDCMSLLAFVEPEASDGPCEGKLNLRLLADEDREFLRKYLGGQVLADGTPLDSFPGGESGNFESGGHPSAELSSAAD
jgi:hypothetical protein